MVGFDNEWIQTTDRHKEYSNLPPGRYAFKVGAIDIDGIYTQLDEIVFLIKPPFWQRIWFLSLSGLLFAGLVWFLFDRRLKVVKARSLKRGLMQKEMAELKMQALQAQMNPHFLFNALNSIQSFVTEKDSYSANQYLSKFSKLIRLILESSKRKSIKLIEEIEMLELYMQLEQLRFSESFNYTLAIGRNIDVENLEVPSMLIQPFIENAINHGLAYKQGEKKLSISFDLVGESLLCTVVDNGIGRKASREIRTKTSRRHNSMGMDLVNERVKMLGSIGEDSYSFNIHDSFGEDSMPNGTKVEVLVPIETLNQKL